MANASVLIMSNNGVFVSKSSISAAVASADVSGQTILVKTPQTLSGNVTIPSNIALQVEPGGIITTGAFTLTINGPFRAGLYQAFNGNVVFADGVLPESYPEWWGSVGDATANDQAAVQSAVNANAGSCVLTRHYKINTPIIVPNKRNWMLVGRSAGASGNNTKNTLIAGAAIKNMIQFKDSFYSVRIKNILFDAANTATDCVQMGTNVTNGDVTMASNIVNVVFENCEFNRAKRLGVCGGDPNSLTGLGAVIAPQVVSGNGLKFVDCQFSSIYGIFINWGNWYGTILDNCTFSRAELTLVSSNPNYYGQKEMIVIWAGEDLKLRNVYFSGVWQQNTFNILSYSAGISLDHVYTEHYNVLSVLTGAVYPYPAQNIAVRDLVINSVMDDPNAAPTARTSDGTVQTAIYVTLATALLTVDNSDLRSNSGANYISRHIASSCTTNLSNAQLGNKGYIKPTYKGQMITINGMTTNTITSLIPSMNRWSAGVPTGWVTYDSTVARVANSNTLYGGFNAARVTTTNVGLANKGLNYSIPITTTDGVMGQGTYYTAIVVYYLGSGTLTVNDMQLAITSDFVTNSQTDVYDLGGNYYAFVVSAPVTASDITNTQTTIFAGAKTAVGNAKVFDIISAVAFVGKVDPVTISGTLLPLAWNNR